MTSALFWIPFAIGAVLIAGAAVFVAIGFMDMVVSKMGGGR